MPLERLTIQELQEINESILASELGISTPLLPRTIVKILAYLFAAGDHLLYGYIVDRAKQAIITTADTEYLEQWVEIWGIARKDAGFATGYVTFTGVNGSIIPKNTKLIKIDDTEYETDNEVTIVAGQAIASITATIAGSNGNADPDTELSLETPIAGVDSTVTVNAEGLKAGSDIETDEALRNRLLEHIQLPPQAGNRNDYIKWAKELEGITRVWVIENFLGQGTVGVTFVMDDNVNIIPPAVKVVEIKNYIDDRRPLCCVVSVFAPIAIALDMTINLLPNTSVVQNAVTTELEDMLRRESEPGGIILKTHINEAISIAQGEIDHQLIIPTNDVGHDVGELAVLGTITFGDL